jgi:predicted transcriptional regulator
MIAKTQYRLTAGDMEVALALVRSGTLATAGERLGIDASTVLRSLWRIVRALRSRGGSPNPKSQGMKRS